MRSHQAFTFIEILIVVSILGVATYFASVGTAGQNAYYGFRGDVERIVATLQRACIQSDARGDVLNPATLAPVTAGVTFYQSSMSPSFVIGTGCSIVGWFNDDPTLNPNAHLPAPATLAAADSLLKTQSKALRSDTQLCQQFTGLPVTPLTDGASIIYRRGRLDVFNPDGTSGGGITATLNANFLALPSTLGAPPPNVAWSFDVVNSSVGWVRIRCMSGGFVEASGINPLSTTTPLTAFQGVF